MDPISALMLSIPIGLALLLVWIIIFGISILSGLLNNWLFPGFGIGIFTFILWIIYTKVQLEPKAAMGFIFGGIIGIIGFIAFIEKIAFIIAKYHYFLALRLFKQVIPSDPDQISLGICGAPPILASLTLLATQMLWLKQSLYYAFPPAILLLVLGPLLISKILRLEK